MANTLFLLLALGLLMLWWLDSARARELAIDIVSEVCKRRGLQWLDGTVALARMGLRWRRGPIWRRMFRFEYSAEGLGRREGYVLLLGTSLESVILDEEQPAERPTREVSEATSEDSNVVPFRRRDEG